MSSIYSDVDKVRASNEGDAFHVVWTARRCLPLLNSNGDPVLTAVTVEGVSPSDNASNEAILKADTAEYYGAEAFAETTKFVMAQLKYFPSLLSSKKPLTVSDVKDTFEAFAKDFEGKCNTHGESFVIQKATYLFVTNRFLSQNFQEALTSVHSGKQVTGRVAKAVQSLKEAACLSDDRFKQFVKIFKLHAAEADRSMQEWELKNEIGKYLPGQDAVAPRELSDLIRRKGLLTDNREPIRKLDILQAFKIPSEDNLLPAPPSKAYRLPEKHIPRIQEKEIADEIIATTQPIIIHASGGIGKSVLALSLPKHMPEGSQYVIFDGFADGLWREPGKPRHQHDRGLVQIANELAVQGLCDQLLPSPNADKHHYIEAFLHRLKQAAHNVRQSYPGAIILIILDAADNSQMAADLHEPNTRSFPIDLLNKKFPPNCRLVVLARTERIETHLKPSSSVKKIELKPFTEAETSSLLKCYHPNISNKSVKEFHRMTSANPRGQFYGLNSGKDFNAMMSSLGRNPLGIDELIGQQLHAAVSKVKEDSASDKQINRLCIALAALPPLVPISILAKAADVTEPLVRSFISDIGHYLMEIDGSLHFRDEPAETWFRINFAKPDHYAELILALKPLNSDPYVAMALPELMYHAGQLEELISLSLSNEGLSFNSPVEQRHIVLHRVRFSLKAAIEKKHYLNILKLAFRAGEEVAGNNREAKLLLDNHDLVSKLFGAKSSHEIIFRHHPKKWLGAGFAHGAAMLSGDAHSRGEARNMLRCAGKWLKHWAELPDEERTKQQISDEDKEAIAFANLYIQGPKAMVSYLEGWTQPIISFIAGAGVIRRLIDAGNFGSIDELATIGCENFYLVLAVANELAKVGRIPPKQSVHRAIKLLLAMECIETKHIFGFGQRDDFLAAIISLAEAGAQLAIPKRTLIQLLNKYMPGIPPYSFTSDHNEDRGCILRFHCLKGALEGIDIQLQNVAPERIKKDLASAGYVSSSDVREFKEIIGILLPWYKLRAQVILGIQNNPVQKEIEKVKDATKCDWDYGNRRHFIANELVTLWLDILVRGGAANQLSINSLKCWMNSISVAFYIHTRISLTRVLARYDTMEDEAYEFAKEIDNSCEADRSDANSRAGSYVDLARAVLAISENEASAYFNKALEVVSRFGDEISDRWNTVISLANKAGTPTTPNPELSYNYARTAEVVSEYIGDNFPWGGTVSAASKICPSSGFAILGRWHDRDKGVLGEMLPALTTSLLNDKLLTPESASALNAFEGYWDLPKLAEAVIQSKTPYQSLILNEFIHDIQIQGDLRNAAKFNMAIKKYGLSDERLETMVVHYEKQKEKPPRVMGSFIGDEQEELKLNKETPKANWEKIIGSKTFLNAGEIDTALQSIEILKPYCWPFQDLLEKIRNAVPRDKEVQHLKAIINSSEMDIWQIINALEDAKALWKNRAAVQKALKHIATEVLEKKAPLFADSPIGLSMKLEALEKIGSINRDDLIAPFLKGISESMERIDASTFFIVGHQMVRFLSPEEAKDALEYALNRMQVEIKESDGDGEWYDGLRPPEDISSAVAAYIYAALGNPQQRYRWQAAHAVIRLCKLEEIHAVSSLIKLVNNTSLPVFTDCNLPFYHWHARLYLMIALARAAKENPAILKDYIGFFLKWALDEPRHKLISHFAAQAALTIENHFPNTIGYEKVVLLKRVNISPFMPKLQDRSTKSGWSMAEQQALNFCFPYDFDRYWIGTLSDVFALPYSEVATPIQKWIFKEGGNSIGGKTVKRIPLWYQQ